MQQEKQVEPYILTVRYLNGKVIKFQFPQQFNPIQQATRLQKIIQSNQLILALKDRVILIPMSSLESIELSPIPEKLPDIVIENVELITEESDSMPF